MTTLWNPRRHLNQPPGYGTTTAVKGTPTSCPIAESAALEALKEAQLRRTRNSGSTPFDRGRKGRE